MVEDYLRCDIVVFDGNITLSQPYLPMDDVSFFQRYFSPIYVMCFLGGQNTTCASCKGMENDLLLVFKICVCKTKTQTHYTVILLLAHLTGDQCYCVPYAACRTTTVCLRSCKENRTPDARSTDTNACEGARMNARHTSIRRLLTYLLCYEGNALACVKTLNVATTSLSHVSVASSSYYITTL